jgi:hypothetical protein
VIRCQLLPSARLRASGVGDATDSSKLDELPEWAEFHRVPIAGEGFEDVETGMHWTIKDVCHLSDPDRKPLVTVE